MSCNKENCNCSGKKSKDKENELQKLVLQYMNGLIQLREKIGPVDDRTIDSCYTSALVQVAIQISIEKGLNPFRLIEDFVYLTDLYCKKIQNELVQSFLKDEEEEFAKETKKNETSN